MAIPATTASVPRFVTVPSPSSTSSFCSAAAERAGDNPWPQWPRIYRVDYGHTEVHQHTGKDPREYAVLSEEFVDDGTGQGRRIATVRVEWTKSATGGWDMKKARGLAAVLPRRVEFFSTSFLGPEQRVPGSEIELDARKNVKTPAGQYSTNVEACRW